MSWRDQYRTGSWRGVRFRTVDSEQAGGRRGESHEFPQRDEPWREDLGRKGRTYTLNCWVAGDDYWSARDALIDACEAEGPGTLVHPFRGELTLASIDYSCTESAVDGGVADFSIVFAETSEEPASATSSPDSAALAKAAGDSVLSAAPASFAARFTSSGFPGFIEDAGVALVDGIATLTRIASAPMGGAGATLRAFDAGLKLLPASARALVRSPLTLAQSTIGLFAALSALAPDPRRRAAAARTMMSYGGDLKPVTGSTPPRVQQAANQAAAIALVRVAAGAHLVEALADTRFASYQDAAQARDDATIRLDSLATLLADNHDDDGWRQAIALRTACARDLTERGATLARVYTFRPRTTEPALVIARRLTDRTPDLIARSEDIVARNLVRHPGFVPGGVDLSILQERGGMTDEVSLSIDGKIYTGWKEVAIVRSIVSMTGSFRVFNAARGDGKDSEFQFKAGAAVNVAIDGETIIKGYVDAVEPSFDKESHGIAISGRDRSADLVDCSAVHKPGSWSNTSIEAIAAELAKPFGVTVTAKADTAPKLKKFALQQGESVHAAIERMLRYRGLLAVTTPEGDVEIITPKAKGADAQLAKQDLLAASATHDVSERFSDYIVKGQASGDDETNGKAVSAPSSKASDPAVSRHRPLIVIGEEQSSIASLEKRAKWEATTRAGKAQQGSLTMRGWHSAEGALWAPNTVIGVSEPWLFIESDMLVTEVTYTKGEGGTTTELAIAAPEAWSQMAVPEEADAGKVKR